MLKLTPKQRYEALVEATSIIDEVGKRISAASGKKLEDAIKAMGDAMQQISVLLSNETEAEEAINVSDDNTNPLLLELKAQDWSYEEAAKILAQDDSYDSKRCAVSAALRRRALAAYAQQKMITGDYEDYYYDMGPMPYIRDLYDEQVVYTVSGELYQCDYTIGSDGEVTLGDPTPVKVSYVPSTESAAKESFAIDIKNETIIRLEEKAVTGDGKAKIKVISPGWGSSGYYSEKMLQRDGPKVFKKGLHMYVNHPTAQEDLDRPERDLRDLVGVLETDAKYDKNGATGPGLYADASVFENYRQFVNDAAPYIGTSIRASGRAVEGEAEGRHGYIIDALTEGYSVDYVTAAGRGGEVLPLLEAVRTRLTEAKRADDAQEHTNIIVEKKELEVTPEEALALTESVTKVTTANTELRAALDESNKQIARMSEAMLLRGARDVAIAELGKIDLSDVTRARLVEQCAKNPPITETGELDVTTFIETVKKVATEEMAYLQAAVGGTNGRPNVGSASTATISNEDADKELTAAFSMLGMSENGVKAAVGGRTN